MKVPQVEIKKILYTTDLSESGRYAFSYAASLSNLYGAELTVLHIVEEEPELDKRLVGYVSEELWEEIKNRDLQEARDILVSRKRDNTAIIRECLDKFCAEAQENVPEDAYVKYDIVIKLGHPVEQILSHSEAGNYDLIVIGSHGHSALQDVVMGDTVRRIVRRSTIPVLVVKLPQEES